MDLPDGRSGRRARERGGRDHGSGGKEEEREKREQRDTCVRRTYGVRALRGGGEGTRGVQHGEEVADGVRGSGIATR